MKTIGLIGGMTWVSTVDYYRIINEQVSERLGGINSARILLYSVNQGDFKPPSNPEEMGDFPRFLISAAKHLENAGAACILLCANTAHIAAELIQKNIEIPLIHIADVTAKEVVRRNIKKVGLLGTKLIMEHPFYKEKLSKFNITTLIPEDDQRDYIHKTIYNELAKGIAKDETRNAYREIIDSIMQKGAEGIVLGCTEIDLLIKEGESKVPVFDTTKIHAMAAVEFALSDEKPKA